MCGPEAMAGAAVAGSVVSVMQQRRDIKGNISSERKRHKLDTERSKRDSAMNRSMLDQQALEDSYATNDSREQLALQSLREAGSKKATGSTGVSSMRSMLATSIQQDIQEGKINLNEENALFRNQAEQTGISTNFSDRKQNSQIRIDNAKRQRLTALDYTGAAIGAGAGATSAYMNTKAAQGG
jgi:hypothetical protein